VSERMWLTVDVNEGMFPTERTITVQTANGLVSLFAPAECVQAQTIPGRGVMEVHLLDHNERYALVSLPSGTIEGGSVVKVERTALQTP
jgi:hypothetical protein